MFPIGFEAFTIDTDSTRYKGMAHAVPSASTRQSTPQATGFSQVATRGGGEGGAQAMSVLLSWHEKVRRHTRRDQLSMVRRADLS